MRRLLRLWVMTKINHTEEYVKTAIGSSDTDLKNLTHNQIAAYKATLKQIEADLMIDMAFEKGKPTRISDIDISVFKPCTKTY